MLARLSSLRGNGTRTVFFFRSLLPYSTTAASAQPQQPHFLTDFLINSLGFSEEAALCTARRVRQKSTRKDPILVVNFLEKLGLTKAEIKTIVTAAPAPLLLNVGKTLEPKVRFFHELGISGPDLIKILLIYKSLLRKGVDSFRPPIEYLRKLLGSDEKVAKAVTACPLLLHENALKNLEPKILLLRNFGLSDQNLSKFLLTNPSIFYRHPFKKFQDVLHLVENEFGIPRTSKQFYPAVHSLLKLNSESVARKFGTLRSFGWSDATIYSLFRTIPGTLNISEDKLRKALNFYMKEVGYAPEYLASHPILFCFSFEKRVKPRVEVFNALNENKLNKRNVSLYSVLCSSELKFLKDYLLPYKDEIPHVYETYLKVVGADAAEKL